MCTNLYGSFSPTRRRYGNHPRVKVLGEAEKDEDYMPLEIADEDAFRIEKITPIDRHWNDNKGDTVTLMMNPSEVEGGGVRPIEERIANSHTGLTWHHRLGGAPLTVVKDALLNGQLGGFGRTVLPAQFGKKPCNCETCRCAAATRRHVFTDTGSSRLDYDST